MSNNISEDPRLARVAYRDFSSEGLVPVLLAHLPKDATEYCIICMDEYEYNDKNREPVYTACGHM